MQHEVLHRREPIKPDITQMVDHYGMETKQFAFRCDPLTEDLSGLFDYEIDNEVALVLPIFISWQAKYNPYAEALAKVVPYLIRDLLTKTDIPEQGVHVCIAVGDTAVEYVMPYLRACGLSESHAPVFHTERYHLANKIMAVLFPGFGHFEKVVWLDVMHEVALGDSDEKLPVGRVLRDWNALAQPLLIPRPNFRTGFRHPKDKVYANRKARFNKTIESNAERYAKAVEHIYVDGWANGFGRELRTDYMKSKLRYLSDITNGQNDEYVMEVVASELGLDRVACLSDMGIHFLRTPWKVDRACFRTLNKIADGINWNA